MYIQHLKNTSKYNVILEDFAKYSVQIITEIQSDWKIGGNNHAIKYLVILKFKSEKGLFC